PLALRLLQVLRHVVEGGRQLSQLVIPAVVVHADVEVPLRIAAGGLGHLPDGLDLPHGGDGGRHEGDHQHHERRHEEQPDEAGPHGVQRGGGGHGIDHADGVGGILAYGRNAHHEPLVGVQAVHVRAPGADALLQHLCGHLLRHSHHQPAERRIRGQQHVALHVADQEVHLGHRGSEGGQTLEVLLVLQLLHVQVPPVFQIAGGELPHHLGLGGQLPVLLAPGVVVAQGEKRNSQQKQRQEHHADGDEHLPPVQAPELVVHPFCNTRDPYLHETSLPGFPPEKAKVFSGGFVSSPLPRGRLPARTCTPRPTPFSAPTGCCFPRRPQ
ncbi:2-oxoisovalerate dehydrogenase subunit beta, partial [Dysosmobacter welbionis]